MTNTIATTEKTIDSRDVKVFNHLINVSFRLREISAGKVALYVYINGKSWTLWNLCNHKRDKESSFKDVEYILKEGSYTMFV